MSKSRSRSAARLAAVQALYQHEMEGTPLAPLLHEFHQHRLGAEVDDEDSEEARYASAEADFFDDIVSGVLNQREALDALITARLASGWSLARLDRTMLQILRSGCYELKQRQDISRATVINEYLDVAHAFFDRNETRFVNGLLDAIAGDVRDAQEQQPTE